MTKLIATKRSEQNQTVLDPWTVVHFGTGLAAGLVGLRMETTVGLGIAYEVGEQVFQRSDGGKTLFNISGPEPVENAIADILVLAAGHYLGNKWNRRK
jgi:hypothetical protein